ncbi:MAG: hypothetical protein RL266_2048 [Bacteroidota bacterium]|jgi:acylphosphatase
MKTVSITVTGKVQGVWFRKYTCDKAVQLGLHGTVRNMLNGDVLILATGHESELQKLESWCWKGSPQSSVRSVRKEEIALIEFADFRILE